MELYLGLLVIGKPVNALHRQVSNRLRRLLHSISYYYWGRVELFCPGDDLWTLMQPLGIWPVYFSFVSQIVTILCWYRMHPGGVACLWSNTYNRCPGPPDAATVIVNLLGCKLVVDRGRWRYINCYLSPTESDELNQTSL